MTLLIIIAFLLAVAGSFLLLELSPFTFWDGLTGLVKPEKTTLKSRIGKLRKGKQPKGIRLLVMETRAVLHLSGKDGRFMVLCMFSMGLFIFGVLVAVTMKNTYMVPVLAVGLSLLPFYYVQFMTGRHKKQVNIELETALSMITNQCHLV